MLKLILSLKRVLHSSETIIDNAVFALHYKWSVTILLIFSALVTWKQNWGNPIECISDHKHNDIVETFCWNEATFSIPSSWNKTVGVQVPYPGVTNSKQNLSTDRRYHAYYQWVGLTLFLQAILFCIPRYAWKCEEKGFMRNLTMGLNTIVSREVQDEKLNQVIHYLRSSKSHHKCYVYLYISCEFCNFANVISQMYFLDVLMGGEFVHYGLYTFQLRAERYNYLGYRIFPKMTKCLFYDFGTSGDVQTYDAFCLLPLNILHEKIFAFLFLWFFLVAIVSAVLLLHRCFTFVSTSVRAHVLFKKAPVCPKAFIRDLCKKLSFDDWFLLYMIAKNISPVYFRDIANGITVKNPSECDDT